MSPATSFKAELSQHVAYRILEHTLDLEQLGDLVDLLEHVLGRFPDLTLREFLGAVILAASE